jgi:hypothetical protein
MAYVPAIHSAAHCPGNCNLHPLTDVMMVRMTHSSARWGDILYEPVAIVEEECVREHQKLCDSVKMRTYAKQQLSATKKKIHRPCKWLFIEKDGKSYGSHLTGEECWAWEYTDPRSGNRECPHTCHYLHPNEFGWRDEWN